MGIFLSWQKIIFFFLKFESISGTYWALQETQYLKRTLVSNVNFLHQYDMGRKKLIDQKIDIYIDPPPWPNQRELKQMEPILKFQVPAETGDFTTYTVLSFEANNKL